MFIHSGLSMARLDHRWTAIPYLARMPWSSLRLRWSRLASSSRRTSTWAERNRSPQRIGWLDQSCPVVIMIKHLISVRLWVHWYFVSFHVVYYKLHRHKPSMTGMVYTTHLTHLGLAQDLPGWPLGTATRRPRIDTGAALIQRHQAEPEKYRDMPDAGFKDQPGW